jgi:magnesium-transporting ATPase (P-type)
MLKILRQPYPLDPNPKRRVIAACCFGVFISLFLFVFQPFGIENIRDQQFKILFLSGYGAITIVAALGYLLSVRKLFPKWMSEKSWTVGRQIVNTLFIICLVSLLNMVYTNTIFNRTFYWVQIPYWAGVTLLVSVIPVSFSVALRQGRLKNETAKLSLEMNEEIHHREEEKVPETAWKFRSENEKEVFETHENDLLFVEAADNYSTFYFFNAGNVKKEMLRGSLKKMEEQIVHPALFRCHRTYIANLSNVTSVSGNAQGYRLHFKQTDLTIPVSRNLGKELKDRLK